MEQLKASAGRAALLDAGLPHRRGWRWQRHRVLIHRLHGEAVSGAAAGPSALQQGIPQAWANVLLAIRGFEAAGLAVPQRRRCALGAGLSGVSHGLRRDAFLAADPGFAALEVETDSFTVLMGAHGGQPAWC